MSLSLQQALEMIATTENVENILEQDTGEMDLVLFKAKQVDN